MRKLVFIAVLLVVTGHSILMTGCANIVPPQGGPRDSLPPVLVKVTPGDSTRNFSGDKITFTFNEYVDLQNIQEQLMVSPAPKINPVVDFRLNTVTVKLKDQLEPNTTYAVNFGESIRDYTEGNPLKGFTYTFSTGPYIDSLQLKGTVVLAETGKIDTTLIVMLHTSGDDSAVVKEKPRYVTKLDSKGSFVFKNLPPRDFYLYALKDEGNTRRYFNDRQMFAFASTPVKPGLSPVPVTLYAYSVKPSMQQVITTATNTLGKKRNNETVVDNRLKFQTNLNNNQQDLMGNFELRFDNPLRNFDSSKMKLYTDSSFQPVFEKRIVRDSSNKKIIISTNWKENTVYHLVLAKDFADDSLGRKLLKDDTLDFTTKKLIDYGSVKLKFRNLDLSKNPVLQLVLDNNIYQSVTLTTYEFSRAMFYPGEYELRILYDDNKNGVWDPGEFFGKHRQPEIVVPVQRKVTVRPNFANEVEIQL